MLSTHRIRLREKKTIHEPFRSVPMMMQRGGPYLDHGGKSFLVRGNHKDVKPGMRGMYVMRRYEVSPSSKLCKGSCRPLIERYGAGDMRSRGRFKHGRKRLGMEAYE